MTRLQPTRHGHGGKPEPEVGKDRSPRAKTRPTSPAGEVFVTLSLLAHGNDEKRNSEEGAVADERDTTHREKDALLPDDSPHNDLYSNIVPVWCEGKSPDDLDSEIGDGYSCGFSAGFERGIITAMLKPEWVQGMYHRIRQYYLTTHAPQDLLDWNDHAEETTRAVPVSNAGFVSESREMKLALELPGHIDTTAYRSGVRSIIMSKHTRKERP